MTPYIIDRDTTELSRDIADYPEGIVIPIDKPYRWTSADVIRKVKFAAVRHFGKKNLKVGHAGTLDPLATGVLLVCIGNATKMAEEFQSHDKEYIAGITFGATTPSYDLEKDVDRFFPFRHITEKDIADALVGFVGEQEQVAPLFSAKSVDGVRAYELARKLFRQQAQGQTAGNPGGFDEAAESLLRVSRIHIHNTELLSFTPAEAAAEDAIAKCSAKDVFGATDQTEESTAVHEENAGKAARAKGKNPNNAAQAKSKNPDGRINVADTSRLGLPKAEVRISCSKGTYIRAFARDLGEALESGAHLHSLQRSCSGDFHVSSAIPVVSAIALFHSRSGD